MSSSNDSKIEILRLKLSKMVLNDSRAIFRRKQMEKLNKQHWLEHSALRKNRRVQRRLFNASKRMAPIKQNQQLNDWKSEYDLLNMITYSINKGSGWNGNDIGIQTSHNQIKIIENLNEFNQQFLIDANGNTIQAKNVIQPNDLLTDNCLRIKYKLIPVIESFTLVKSNCPVENEYKICTETTGAHNDLNDNNNNKEHRNKNFKKNSMPNLDKNIENRAKIDTDDVTITPTEDNQFEGYEPLLSSISSIEYASSDVPEYVEFMSSIQTSASSTIAQDETILPVSTPSKKKAVKSGCKIHIDSSRPNVTEKISCSDHSIQSDIELEEMIEVYERIRAQYMQLGGHLRRVKMKIKKLIQANHDERNSTSSCYRDI